jgi:large subunit ribosomal protein L14e
MFEVGRWCMKIAGRDGGKKCIIIAKIDDHTVLVDGETRRKKTNVLHLEPLLKTSDIAESASHEEIMKIFKDEGIEIPSKKPKQKGEKPKRKVTAPTPVPDKLIKKAPKKAKK